MTNDTTELAPAPSESEVSLGRALQDLRRQYNGVREALEEGLKGVDEDNAELICDFLNANTPWEFSLEQEFRVEVRGWITVTARNEHEARSVVEDADWTPNQGRFRDTDHEMEVESFEVRSVEEA